MALYKQDIVDVDLNTGNIFRSFMNHSIGFKDDDANRFGIRAFRDGEPVDLTGVSCQAVFMAPNGNNIALTSYGTVSGNVAYVTLPQACYDYEGQFCLAIKLVGGGVTGTVRIVDGTVTQTGASGAVAPTAAVPTYQEILAVYAEMQEDIENYESVVANQNDQINSLKSALSGIKEGEIDGYRHVSVWKNGSWSTSGPSLISGNKRIRPDQFINVKKGDIVQIENGSYVHAVGVWRGTLASSFIVRNDDSFNSNDETLYITTDGFFVVIFADAQDQTAVVDPAQFDGGITVTSYSKRTDKSIIENAKSLRSAVIDDFYDVFDSISPDVTANNYVLQQSKFARYETGHQLLKYEMLNDEVYVKCNAFQWQAVAPVIEEGNSPTNVIGDTIVGDIEQIIKRPSGARWLIIEIDTGSSDYFVKPIKKKTSGGKVGKPFFLMVNYTRKSTDGLINEQAETDIRITTAGSYYMKKGASASVTGSRSMAVYSFNNSYGFVSETYWYKNVFIAPADGYYAFTIKNNDGSDISYTEGMMDIQCDSYNDSYIDALDATSASLLSYGTFDTSTVNSSPKAYLDRRYHATYKKLIKVNKNLNISTKNTNYRFFIIKIHDDLTYTTLATYTQNFTFEEECKVIITFTRVTNPSPLTNIDMADLFSCITWSVAASGSIEDYSKVLWFNADRNPNDLCIMTYNVGFLIGRNANIIMQNAIIDKFNPDIIGFQEFRDTIQTYIPTFRTILKFYEYTHYTTEGAVNYKGLASRVPFGQVTANAFEHQESERRGYSKTYLQFNNKSICWINCHIALDETVKVQQCREVFELVQNEEYFIITGDFNTDYCFSVNDEEYTTIMKQFIDAGFNSANCSEQHGFIGTFCGAPTIPEYNHGIMRPDDHIITSANITINGVFADATKTLSQFVDENVIDHFPLIAYVTVN